jgi:hypothetical protein
MQTLYKNSAVSLTPLTKIDTADQGTSKFSVLWLLLNGIPIEKSYIGKLYYTTYIHTKNMGVNYGSLLWSAVSLTPLTTKKVEFIVEYLRKYKAICKKALTCVSGAQLELFDEKNQRSKISWQGPFKGLVT